MMSASVLGAWPLDVAIAAIPPSEIGDALLERVGGGVHDAGVDVSELLQSEQVRRAPAV